jgi:hypothetical protein
LSIRSYPQHRHTQDISRDAESQPRCYAQSAQLSAQAR